MASRHDFSCRPQGRAADSPIPPPALATPGVESDLRAAIERNEIKIVFQPQYDLIGGALTGAEALARWRHPRLGVVGADALFAIPARADHVMALSRRIAEQALAEARAWPAALRLSLNVTPDDLASPGFAGAFRTLVAASGFPAQCLTLEITEQVLLGDLDSVAATLAVLKRSGIEIALDDFGSGFCNFRYMKRLPLDRLKLDRSMVQGIESDPRDLAVLRAIVALARALGLSVVAEGIESEEQRAIAAREGCTSYQGFLGSPPLAPGDFLALATRSARVDEVRAGG